MYPPATCRQAGDADTQTLLQEVGHEANLLPLLVGACRPVGAVLQNLQAYSGGAWPTTLLPRVARPIAMASVGTVVAQLGRAYAWLVARLPSDRLVEIDVSRGPPCCRV